MEYRNWIHAQLKAMDNCYTRDLRLNPNAAAYLIPAQGAKPGSIIIAAECPKDGIALSFPLYGAMTTKIGFIPRSAWEMGLYDACRDKPIYPVAA